MAGWRATVLILNRPGTPVLLICEEGMLLRATWPPLPVAEFSSVSRQSKIRVHR